METLDWKMFAKKQQFLQNLRVLEDIVTEHIVLNFKLNDDSMPKQWNECKNHFNQLLPIMFNKNKSIVTKPSQIRKAESLDKRLTFNIEFVSEFRLIARFHNTSKTTVDQFDVKSFLNSIFPSSKFIFIKHFTQSDFIKTFCQK